MEKFEPDLSCWYRFSSQEFERLGESLSHKDRRDHFFEQITEIFEADRFKHRAAQEDAFSFGAKLWAALPKQSNGSAEIKLAHSNPMSRPGLVALVFGLAQRPFSEAISGLTSQKFPETVSAERMHSFSADLHSDTADELEDVPLKDRPDGPATVQAHLNRSVTAHAEDRDGEASGVNVVFMVSRPVLQGAKVAASLL